MKPRILLIGSTGQVGHELAFMLPRVGEVIVPDRAALDLTRASDVARVISDTHPQIIVNAAAYTAVDLAEKEPEKARAINTEAPAAMAAEAAKLSALLVHYSTDYVFDGSKESPYVEDDHNESAKRLRPNKARRRKCDSRFRLPPFDPANCMGLRDARQEFLLTILRLASQREELRIVSDQIGAPTWAREIARATNSMLERHAAAAAGDAPAEWHLSRDRRRHDKLARLRHRHPGRSRKAASRQSMAHRSPQWRLDRHKASHAHHDRRLPHASPHVPPIRSSPTSA